MKVLKITTIVCLCSSVALLAADQRTMKSQEPEPTMISIGSLASGWQLIINRDGSGKLMYGSSIGDMSLIKKGTFDFRETYGTLSAPQKWSEEKSAVSVGFMFDRPAANYGKYLRDEHVWMELVSKAKKNLMSPNADRIIDLLNKRPPESRLNKPVTPATVNVPFAGSTCLPPLVIVGAKVSKAEDALKIALQNYISGGGMSASEAPSSPSVITLESDEPGFGKKGDKVWKIEISDMMREGGPSPSAVIRVHSQTQQVQCERYRAGGGGKSDVGANKREHARTVQQEMEEKTKQAIKGFCRGRSGGSEQEIDDAIAILKEGASSKQDDLALVVLSGIQRNLVGMRKAEWTPEVVSNYYECVSHLKNVRLDAETKKSWSRYSELKDMQCELNGGDKTLSLVIRGQLLAELKQYVDRAKKSNEGDVQEIQTFIRKEAKAILQEWPESELRKMIEKLAADQ